MSPRARWAALAVLSVSLLIVVMDMTILIMAMPDLIDDLAPSATQQLWIVDVYSLVLAGLLIPMSALADRRGRRRILLVGFSLFGLGSLLVVAADGPGTVISLRALLGLGGAMVMPTTLSLIRTIFADPRERAMALAVWSVVTGVGAVFGPLAGGVLLQFFDWRSAFLVNVPFALVAIIGGLILLPESRAERAAPWDWPAVAASIGGMSLLVWGIKRLAHEGWRDAPAWTLLVVGAALAVWFVGRCARRDEPLLQVRLFRRGPFSAGALAALGSMFALTALLLLVAQWLQVVAGYSPVVAGVALLPLMGGSLLFAPFAPGLALRFGARGVLAGGLAVAGAGLLLLYAAGSPLSYPALVGPLVLAGAGMGSLAGASAIIMGASPPDRAGDARDHRHEARGGGELEHGDEIAVIGIAPAEFLFQHRLQHGDHLPVGVVEDAAEDHEEEKDAARTEHSAYRGDAFEEIGVGGVRAVENRRFAEGR